MDAQVLDYLLPLFHSLTTNFFWGGGGGCYFLHSFKKAEMNFGLWKGWGIGVPLSLGIAGQGGPVLNFGGLCHSIPSCLSHGGCCGPPAFLFLQGTSPHCSNTCSVVLVSQLRRNMESCEVMMLYCTRNCVCFGHFFFLLNWMFLHYAAAFGKELQRLPVGPMHSVPLS